MSEFAPDTPAPNGPAPNGPRPQGGATTAPGFAPPRDDRAGADRGPAPPEAARAPAPQAPEQHAAPRQATPRTTGDDGRPPAPAAQVAPVDVRGRIHIADEVVEKVAALAAQEVSGVADLGGDFARAVESVRERIGIGSKRGDQGIKADVNGSDVVISVTVMVEFGHVVLDVARNVQRNVATKTQRMLGLRVVEVNVTVDDVRTAHREDEPTDVVVTAG